jgi:hypothetical protein
MLLRRSFLTLSHLQVIVFLYLSSCRCQVQYNYHSRQDVTSEQDLWSLTAIISYCIMKRSLNELSFIHLWNNLFRRVEIFSAQVTTTCHENKISKYLHENPTVENCFSVGTVRQEPNFHFLSPF